MALGVSRLDVLRMVVGEGLRFTAFGLAAGRPGAFFPLGVPRAWAR